MSLRHVILDRDGVLNYEAPEGSYVREPAEFRWLPGALDAVLYCPHANEEQCSCRKPAPGLILAAVACSGIASSDTIVVGDDRRDLEAAERAGVAAALVRTGKGRQTEALLGKAAVPAYDDLRELARAILTARP